MYVLNVPICVYELILSFLLFIQRKSIIAFINANVGPGWLEKQLNILVSTNQKTTLLFSYF